MNEGALRPSKGHAPHAVEEGLPHPSHSQQQGKMAGRGEEQPSTGTRYLRYHSSKGLWYSPAW